VKPQSPDVIYHADREKAAKNVQAAQAALDKRKSLLAQVDAKSSIVCCACHSVFPISTQVYIQTHWYTRPHGCNGGDYWNEGEGNWKCPDCGFKNRFDSKAGGWMGRPELVALKGKFAFVRECYCDYDSTCEQCLAAPKAVEGANA